MNLTEQLNSISSRQELVEFIMALIADYENNSASWENKDLPNYLDGLAGWTQDMQGYFHNIGEEMPEQPSWALFAAMLLAAKDYE